MRRVRARPGSGRSPRPAARAAGPRRSPSIASPRRRPVLRPLCGRAVRDVAVSEQSAGGAVKPSVRRSRRSLRQGVAPREVRADVARRSAGAAAGRSPVSVSTEVSAACTVTLSAAITRPAPSRSGAATERMPGASCSSVSAQPWARTSRSAASSSARSGCQRARDAGPARLGEHAGRARRRQPGEQHLARARSAGAGNRVPISTAQRDDLRHGDPGDVDDVGAVELGDRATTRRCGRRAAPCAGGRRPTGPAAWTYVVPSSSTRGVSA